MTEQLSPSKLRMIGIAAGVWEGAAFGAASYFLFENPAFAVGIGIVAAVGGMMFLPYMMSMSAIKEGTVSPAALLGPESIHGGALGIALSTGAIVGLAARFVVESTAEPLAAAVGYAAISFLVFRHFLPWDADVADARGQAQ